jgi:GR25 family glycosyltransferase involved in LPS biosynthesis
MELMENCYVINLEKNVERFNEVQKELEKINVSCTRFNAIQHEKGNIGCCMSHLECLKLAKERNLPYVMIWEDDSMFFRDPKDFLAKVTSFHNNVKEWDVLLVSANNFRPFDKINDNYIQVKNAQCANAYIVKNHYYQTLIDIFNVAKTQLLRGSPSHLFMSDIIWKYLQYKHKWYMIIPNYITQRPYYSDIERKNVDYLDAYSNYDKINVPDETYYIKMKDFIERCLAE